MLVRCTLTDAPLLLEDADEVVDVLLATTHGWHFQETSETTPPAIRVIRCEGGFMIAEEGHEPFCEETAVSAACSLIVILLNHMVQNDADRLCLHAGAVSIGGPALIFPSTHRAGKSTLTTALAFRGARLLADDILPLDCAGTAIRAITSGVSPRLRLPLAPALGLRFRLSAWLRAGPDDGYYRYINLPAPACVPFGALQDPGAFIFLERDEKPTAARLHAVSKASAMRMLLLQNFGTAAPSGIVLDRIDHLADDVPAFLLRYGDLGAATSLLQQRFSGRTRPHELWPMLDRAELDFGQTELPGSAQPDPMPLRSRVVGQCENVMLKEAEGSVFLVHEEHGGIFVLDPIGAAIWQLLEVPASTHEVAEMISEAYPDVPPARIAGDVEGLIETLLAKGLARTMDAPEIRADRPAPAPLPLATAPARH